MVVCNSKKLVFPAACRKEEKFVFLFGAVDPYCNMPRIYNSGYGIMITFSLGIKEVESKNRKVDLREAARAVIVNNNEIFMIRSGKGRL